MMYASESEGAKPDRLREIFEAFLATTRQLVRRNRLSHEEYRRAVNFLGEVAQKGELMLMLDVFLEATVDDVDSAGRGGTATSVEGPYYVPDALLLRSPCTLPHRADEPGEVLFFRGTVRDSEGAPLNGAILDIWQADATGAYSHFNIPASAAPYNLRARVITQEDGRFEVQTWLSAPYHIPKDGPTGALLAALGRHPWRPAHIHVKLTHQRCLGLTTQLYFEGGPYLDSDVVGAVKAPPVVRLGQELDTAEIGRRGLKGPFHTLNYDFLSPRRSAALAA